MAKCLFFINLHIWKFCEWAGKIAAIFQEKVLEHSISGHSMVNLP